MLSGLVLSGIGDAFACISRNKCDVVPSATILTSKLGRLVGREYPWGGGGGVAWWWRGRFTTELFEQVLFFGEEFMLEHFHR